MKITFNFKLDSPQAVIFIDDVLIPYVTEMHMKMNNGKIKEGSKRADFYYRCLGVTSALGTYYGNHPELTKPRWYTGTQ